MKRTLLAVLGALICMIIVSCSKSASYEAQADKAYNQSKKAQGYEQKMLEKRAYIFYQKYLHEQPNKKNLSLTFKKNFLEITLDRANMVLIEGNYEMDAIHLFLSDIDSILTKDSPAELKQRYADFLSTMADSCLARSQVPAALDWINKATSVLDNPSSLEEKKKRIIGDYAKQYFDIAVEAFQQSKADKDPEQAIKAEYYVLLVMVYDPNYNGAAALLSELRKNNMATLSGYAKVVEGKLDKRVNKFDILLAVSKNAKGSMTVSMFNNSYNPQRLKPENFYLVDENGKKYVAANSSKIDPEILDTEHDTKNIHLVFASAPANPKKLVYENGEHYTEKFFF
jgi:hypothetical protein